MMKENKNKDNLIFKMCSRCIMDTSANDINFDTDGICNFCRDFLKRRRKFEKKF